MALVLNLAAYLISGLLPRSASGVARLDMLFAETPAEGMTTGTGLSSA